jgi:hypothetical protein
MKSITARYFVTCLSCPDTFELDNENVIVNDMGEDGNNNNFMM